MPPLAAILIYAVAAAAQWQGHGSRARHAALDAALTAYPEIHARETEKLKNGDPSARFVMARVTNGLGNRNYGIIASFALALYQRAALYVHWPEQHCDGFADAEGVECAAATLESLFADPGIAWHRAEINQWAAPSTTQSPRESTRRPGRQFGRSDDSVRAAMACPATSPMASPFSATGDPCPCFFATRCPAPGSNFSRQLVHYGFAPDTGRASKHHSYEDHGSKPECPGLHE